MAPQAMRLDLLYAIVRFSHVLPSVAFTRAPATGAAYLVNPMSDRYRRSPK